MMMFQFCTWHKWSFVAENHKKTTSIVGVYRISSSSNWLNFQLVISQFSLSIWWLNLNVNHSQKENWEENSNERVEKKDRNYSPYIVPKSYKFVWLNTKIWDFSQWFECSLKEENKLDRIANKKKTIDFLRKTMMNVEVSIYF